MPRHRNLYLIAALILLSACAVHHPPRPYDAGNPLRRVAVLPLKNETTDVDGPVLLRKRMIEALEDHSYVVKDVKETDRILRDQMGITLGGQLDLASDRELGEALGVEGLLYGTLMDFDEMTTGVINVKKVRGKFKLVNAMTGQILWERGLGVRSELIMQSIYGAAAALAARAADARDKDVPWVTVGSMTTVSEKVGVSFAIGLGAKLFTKAIGMHLDYESTQLARMITDNLPWGPGPGVAAALPAPENRDQLATEPKDK